MSIGSTLAAARHQAHLTIEALSEITRIRGPVIEGIEGDDFGPCGGDFYARGHLRTLARALGEDEHLLLAEYDEVTGVTAGPRPTQVFESERVRPERRGPNWAAALAVAVAVVLAFVLVQMFGPDGGDHSGAAGAVSPTPTLTFSRPAPPAAPTVPAPGVGAGNGQQPDAVPTSPPTPVPAVRLRLEAADGRAWVRVSDSAGERLYEGILARGEEREFTDPEQLRVGIGNAHVVQVNVNGRDLGQAGPDARTVYRTYTPDDPTDDSP